MIFPVKFTTCNQWSSDFEGGTRNRDSKKLLPGGSVGGVRLGKRKERTGWGGSGVGKFLTDYVHGKGILDRE